MTDDIDIVPGSGNVSEDLGFTNPEEELIKAKLVREIRAIIECCAPTQAGAAELLGLLKQPDVSPIVTGRTGKFSIDRLVCCLDRLDHEVDIVVRRKPRSRVPVAEAA